MGLAPGSAKTWAGRARQPVRLRPGAIVIDAASMTAAIGKVGLLIAVGSSSRSYGGVHFESLPCVFCLLSSRSFSSRESGLAAGAAGGGVAGLAAAAAGAAGLGGRERRS